MLQRPNANSNGKTQVENEGEMLSDGSFLKEANQGENMRGKTRKQKHVVDWAQHG